MTINKLELQLNQIGCKTFLGKLAKMMGAKIEKGFHQSSLNIPEAFGTGQIICSYWNSNTLGTLLFDCQLKSDLYLSFSTKERPQLILHYSVANSNLLFHTRKDQWIDMEMGYPFFIVSAQNRASVIHFPKGQKNRSSVLFMDRKIFNREMLKTQAQLKEEVKKILKDTTLEKSFFFKGQFNLNGEQLIKAMLKHDNGDLVDSSLLQANSFKLLASQFDACNKEKDSSQKLQLHPYDVEKIKEAKKILVNNLHNPPTIEKLARIVGINQQKLKTGFRQIYNISPYSYLIRYKMQVAKGLLMQGQLSIREIAEKVGYKNPSHFSNKFRDIFGLLPKDMKKKLIQS